MQNKTLLSKVQVLLLHDGLDEINLKLYLFEIVDSINYRRR